MPPKKSDDYVVRLVRHQPEYDPKQTYPPFMNSDDNYFNYCKLYSDKLRMCNHPVVKKNCK